MFVNRLRFSKALLLSETIKDPALLEKFRTAKERVHRPIDNQELVGITSDKANELEETGARLFAIEAGRDEANAFELAVQGTLALLFNPDLSRPRSQVEIHDGRKRIDIEFTNFASGGFWRFLCDHIPCPKVYVECKNYTREVGNPEIDQIAGRFSRERGQFGLLVGRSFVSKDKILETCRDTCRDGRGYIIPLDDEDIKQLITEKNTKGSRCKFDLLFRRYEFLIS